ncbi:hypothetical protein [Couchioplanes caeruleus]|uniref:hypothetical protein n=1 Tax=Couchioplanes caeruleus TaxID=56438 RepID=UPI003CC8346F
MCAAAIRELREEAGRLDADARRGLRRDRADRVQLRGRTRRRARRRHGEARGDGIGRGAALAQQRRHPPGDRLRRDPLRPDPGRPGALPGIARRPSARGPRAVTSLGPPSRLPFSYCPRTPRCAGSAVEQVFVRQPAPDALGEGRNPSPAWTPSRRSHRARLPVPRRREPVWTPPAPGSRSLRHRFVISSHGQARP